MNNPEWGQIDSFLSFLSSALLPQTRERVPERNYMKTKLLSPAVSFLYSHEAVDGGQVVPGAEQEKGETDEDKQAAEVHEEILHDEPPEADPTEIHWDVLTLEEQRQGGG